MCHCIYTVLCVKCKCCLQESVDTLINCVVQNLGFSQGKPVAAFTIYRCLLNWKSFESEKTNVFDRLIQMIGSAIEVIYCLLSYVILCWIIEEKIETNRFLLGLILTLSMGIIFFLNEQMNFYSM